MVDLGKPVTVIEHQYGYGMHAKANRNGIDTQCAVSMVAEEKEIFRKIPPEVPQPR